MPAPRTTTSPRNGMGHHRTRSRRDEQALLEAELSHWWAHSNVILLKMTRSVSSKKIVSNAVDVKRSTTETPKDWLLMLFSFSLLCSSGLDYGVLFGSRIEIVLGYDG